MPYIEAVTYAGKTIEYERYYTARYKKPNVERGENVLPTSKAQKKINDRMAGTKLRRQMAANLCGGDWYLTFTYERAPGEPPRTVDEMKEDYDWLIRQLRKEYRKENPKDKRGLRYFHVMEIGKRTARHHHIAMKYIDPRTVRKLWKHGHITFKPLSDSGQYGKLASYFIKYSSTVLGTENELHGKRWNSSQNLIHPVTKKRIVKEYNCPYFEPRSRKGYYYDKNAEEFGIHEYTGHSFYRYTIIRI